VLECDSEMARCLKFEGDIDIVAWLYLEIQSRLQKTATQTTIIRFVQTKPSILVTDDSSHMMEELD
jgi:hypothetical protein